MLFGWLSCNQAFRNSADSEVSLHCTALHCTALHCTALQVLRVLRPGASEAAAKRSVPSALLQQVVPSPGGAQRGASGGGPPLDMMGRARQLAISELQTPQTRHEGCRALLPTPGGQLLSGGSDHAVRCWHSGRPQQSYVVCAPPPPTPPQQQPQPVGAAATPATGSSDVGGAAGSEGSPAALVDVPVYSYAQRVVQGGVVVVEEHCALQRSSSALDREQYLARAGWAERAAALCHQLGVTDLARAEAGGEALLLSAGADGVVKAWR